MMVNPITNALWFGPHKMTEYVSQEIKSAERKYRDNLMQRCARKAAKEKVRQYEIEAMKIEAYLGTVPRVLYFDADGNLQPARI